MLKRAVLISVTVLMAVALTAFAPQRPYDLLVRNGRILDGSGNPWIRADVAIRDGRIVTIGRLEHAAAARTIDAADRYVTPGFIDVHSHAGESIARPELRQDQPAIAQGVTTLIINPDGGGPTDLAAQRATLEKGGLGPNLALLIGHGSVRRAVLREEQRAPTPTELDQMRALVRRGMEEGAYGLSSGLFYVPGSFAKTEEVIALAQVAGEFGGVYTSHIRDESNYNVGLIASVDEVIRIADEGHLRGIVSHMKALGPDSWGLSTTALAHIDAARARGVQVFADQYPYEASSTSLRAALMPGGLELPGSTGQPGAATPASAKNREQLLAAVRENIRRRGGPKTLVIAQSRDDHSLEGKSLADVASERGIPPEEAALELIAKGVGSIVSFNMSEEDIARIMQQPYTMTSSDGSLTLPGQGRPHPRNNGAFARKLNVYVRERRVVTLESAIRSMTSLPALVFALTDRGAIREGVWADLAIFDPAAVRDRATYMDPHQLASGMSWVIVNGQIVLENGTFTSALPGKVLRRE